MAATREDACNVEPWSGLDVGESLGILLSVFPGGYKRGVDCVLAAHDCQEVDACTALYLADHDKYEAEIEQLPRCGDGSGRTDYCDGNVAKYCVTDDYNTYYQASYDCTLAGATCTVFQGASGEPWATCQAPQLECEGPNMSYCDGTRAVVCEYADGMRSPLSPWVYDCRDAWGSQCVEDGQGGVSCEGPVVSEQQGDVGMGGEGGGGGKAP